MNNITRRMKHCEVEGCVKSTDRSLHDFQEIGWVAWQIPPCPPRIFCPKHSVRGKMLLELALEESLGL